MSGFNDSKKKRYYLPMKRLSASIRMDEQDKSVRARLLLFEMEPAGAYLFCPEKTPIGEPVSLVVETNRPIYLKGRISYCTLISMNTKVIHVDPFNYRVGIAFEFNDKEAETEFVNFYKSIVSKTTAA